MKIEKPKQEETKVDVDLSFKEYFDEIVPFTLNPGETMKHKYTVEIKRAILTQESFEIFKKYENHVHKKEDKQP